MGKIQGDYEMSDIPNKEKSPKRLLYALIVSVVIASVSTLIFMEYDEILRSDPLNENYEVSEWECDGWLEEGKFLVVKNNPITNMELWSVEDKTKMIDIENKILLHCGTSKLDVIEKLPFCLDTWVVLKDLLERMTLPDGERLTNSLPESDQELYRTTYKVYWNNSCDLLQEDIDKILLDK